MRWFDFVVKVKAAVAAVAAVIVIVRDSGEIH
jgi:hypothetical protein